MKEEKLRAICNICIILFLLGLILICFIHTPALIKAAFLLMAIACGVGFVCGTILDRLQRSGRKAKRRLEAIKEQDEKDIRSGKYLYVLEKDKEPVKVLKRAK